MKIKKKNALGIKKLWEDADDSKCWLNDKDYVRVSTLIDFSKGLTVMNIPLHHLSISRDIGDMGIYEFCQHAMQVNEADLSYPIILSKSGAIMDGAHRVCKAILEGERTIRAVRLKEDPPVDGTQD